MISTGPSHREFLRRLEPIVAHGLGLSVDIHSPDLPSLRRTLEARQVPPSYLEVFHAAPGALTFVREQVGDGLLTYHGEGLWVTQPDLDGTAFRQAVDETAERLTIIQSAWSNHECASKYLAGYVYGTYLPPLYMKASAEVVAENARLLQRLLDERCQLATGASPLVLLEMPPLTYFVAGTLSIPTFFRLVTEQAPCGLVLDVGHLWTVFRYSGAARTLSLEQFIQTFLDEFPMDRVVEIHVAGLAVHESSRRLTSEEDESGEDGALPAWTDAHWAPIPPVLFDMLDSILDHPRLTSLKGLALEVDTKPEALIVEEFAQFSKRYTAPFHHVARRETPLLECERECPLWTTSVPASTRQSLEEAYNAYTHVLIGRAEPEGLFWNQSTTCIDELGLYRSIYLPYEILQWGGAVEDMFVETCRQLKERGLSIEAFVSFWFRQPEALSGAYDFFLLKVERFLKFVQEVAPDLSSIAHREAEELQQAYRLANDPVASTHVN